MILDRKRTVNGWSFELNNQDPNDEFYQCRGEIMYDDDHDQMPEPALWSAANKLAGILCDEGMESWIATHSEKGWVEVQKIHR